MVEIICYDAVLRGRVYFQLFYFHRSGIYIFGRYEMLEPWGSRDDGLMNTDCR